MAKSKHSGKKKGAAPRASAPKPRTNPMREKIRAKADAISASVARVDQKINRVLLALLLIFVVLWLCKVLSGTIVRYIIIALFGFSLALNGLSAYRNTRWVGFFLMVFGSLLFLSNLLTLAVALAAQA